MFSLIRKIFVPQSGEHGALMAPFMLIEAASKLTHGGPGSNEEWHVSPTQSVGKPMQ